MIAGVAANQNPFPGLRPFREDEERFFFGRESQVDAMVNKLAATCFLAVVGTSGSGKSSLVNCGLRPALHRGLMVSAGPAWRIARFRPDVNPIRSLAAALAEEGVLYSGYKGDMPLQEIIETYLLGSRKGVVETFRKARLPAGTNLLIVADQFEELFRYGKLRSQDGKDPYTMSENAIAFVNLLLGARFEPGCPIYVVITLRSDFLGECSQFYGLPEAINEGQYLVPRMTRDERRASIAGPVSVGGADISPVLMTRLLNDVGDNPDQLSILQHALNRTWACWESRGAKGELGLEHYMEIGTMSNALNHHANEAFEQLKTPGRAKICEKLFKALTDLGTDPRGIRRPLKLATLKEIAGTGNEDEIKNIIEVFREPSRSFLMPPASEPLEPEKVIDISHESLMRVWERLRRWADDEANSARRYRRLAETAVLEKAGKAGLWRDPELQLALDWQEEQTPTPAWANLYGGDFESAIVFLEKSRCERDHKQAEVVFERRWKRIRLLLILLVAVIFLWRLPGGDFEWWLDKVGYESKIRIPAQHAVPLPLTQQGVQQGLQAVRGVIGKNPIQNAASLLAALVLHIGPYLLGYFALAYFGKWAFRRFAFAKILHEVSLSSSKAVREQKLLEQTRALQDAAVTLQTTYASLWRRSGAYVLALGLFMLGIIAYFVCLVYATGFLQPLLGSAFGSLVLLPFVVGWLYQATMLSSRGQATLGMRAVGIFVTNQNGTRLNFGRATARYFAKVLSYITLGIGFLIQPFTRKRQTLHDLIVHSVVLVRPNKKKIQWWIVVPCVIIGVIDISLVSLLGIGVGLALIGQKEANLGVRYQNGQGVPKDSKKALEFYQKAAGKGSSLAQNNLGVLFQNGEGVPKDPSKAAELYQRAANSGYSIAQNNLGWLYQHGEGVPKDSSKAAELYQKAARQGYTLAQNNLGVLYQHGEGVPKDLSKAAELYQKAADQGNAFAQNNLGVLYENGEGVPKDLNKAAELYQKAADQGNTLAQNNLGVLYQNGEGVPKDFGKAVALYQKAADQGNTSAQNNLGLLYQNGEGVPKDLGKAEGLYQKAADQGNAFAQNNLGVLYQNGLGVPTNLSKAAELYQKSADQGNTLAQNNFGLLYQNGEGVPKDLSKAAELYQKAADQGNALAQLNLGRLYEKGQGVPKDLSKAAELYQKAADGGNTFATLALGQLYEYGQGVPRDFVKAAELYQKAIDQGNTFASVALGRLYEYGHGVPKNLVKEAELYQKAADQGNTLAQVVLGWLYENGQGVPKDLVKAAELLKKSADFYQKAADQGDSFAQDILGWLYENGQGVPKDLSKAAALYQKAADQGDPDAQANLGRLYENGQGVPKDLGKAAELYRKAADQENAAALGRLYEIGQGVPKDLGKAVELYQKAADQADAFAQANLGRLYENGQGVPKDLGKATEFYQRAANQGYQPAIASLKRLSGH